MANRQSRADSGLGSLIEIRLNGTRAVLKTGTEEQTDELLFVARERGVAGDTISVEMTDGAPATTVTVAGTAITIAKAAGATVDDVIRAVNLEAAATALVKVSRFSNSTLQDTVVLAAPLTNLAGGSDLSSWQPIAEAKSVSFSGLTSEILDSTHLCSPEMFREKVASFVDSGTMDIGLNFLADDIASQGELLESQNSGQLRAFRTRFGNSYTYWQVNAYVTNFSTELAFDQIISGQLQLTCSGPIRFVERSDA